MKPNVVYFIGIYCFINLKIFRIEADDSTSTFTEISQVDNPVRESTQMHLDDVKGIQMFNKRFQEQNTPPPQTFENKSTDNVNEEYSTKSTLIEHNTDHDEHIKDEHSKDEQSNDEFPTEESDQTKLSINLRSWRKRTHEQNRPKELTISIPKFKTDVMGNWVYNPWAVTYGDLYRDTEFKFGTGYIETKMTANNEYAKNYYPPGYEESTVCEDKSTAYHNEVNIRWLHIGLYSEIRRIAFNKDVRLTVYTKGDPNQCHTKDYNVFLDYIECAILRNMRMESQVPKYPLHQIYPPKVTYID